MTAKLGAVGVDLKVIRELSVSVFHPFQILGRPTRAFAASMAITVFVVAVWAASTAFPAEAREHKPVTVAMSLTPLSAPIIVAESKRYFKKNGLDVTIKEFVGGFRTIKAVFEGKADIATSSEAVVMFNSFKRTDFAVVCTFVSSDNDVKIITRKDTGIRTVPDLAGRRVGTVKGASAQFFLDETLMLNGVDDARVDMVHVNPEDTPSALARGAVDAVVVWEPQAYLTGKKLGGEAVVVPHERIYTETFNAVALREYADNNPDVLEHFVRALIDAIEFIRLNPDESQRIVSARINSDDEFIKAVWKDFEFGVSLHQWLINTLEAEARWAIGHNLVSAGRVPNYLGFLHLKALDRVRPDSVTVFR
jgi:NitT/TauT family transport system substrate-binding protein